MFLILYLILSRCLISASDGSVPLLLWGVKAPTFPALYTIQSHEFQQIIRDFLKKYSINLYVESELTPHDFSCRNVITQESCFRFLHKVNSSTYYMQVINPVASIDALRRIVWEQFNSSKQLKCSVGTVHGFEFPDKYKQREQQLESHDTFIANFIKKTHCPIVHIYTSHNHRNATERKFSISAQYQRMTNFTEIKDNFIQSDLFAFRFRNIFYKRGSAKYISNHYMEGSSTILEYITVLGISTTPKKNPKHGYVVTFDATPIKITMDLYTPSGYKGVRIRTFQVDNVAFGTSPFNIANKQSYVCNKIVILGMDKSLIILDHVQMEAILYNVTNNTFRFSKPIYCTGIFTPNILAGLFISALIISIVIWGILCILDIGTNKYMGSPDDADLQFGSNE